MNVYHPLPNKPEFSVFECPGYREYRVENQPPSRPGIYVFLWLILPVSLAVLWQFVSLKLRYLISLTFLVITLKQHFLLVQYESVIILFPHGLQLETHRGFSNQWSLLKTTRFIPAANLADIVINEGIKGWNILYYLAAVKSDISRPSSIEVAYEGLLPSLDILLKVYEGIHELFLSRSIRHSSTALNCRHYNHLVT